MNGTPDPTGDALYAAVLAHPDEDTPRLAYADHIEEWGDSHRAEFIRLQCRLAGMSEWDAGYTEADVRCRRRLAEHPEWTAAVGAVRADLVEQAGSLLSHPRGPHGVFARGFPGRVSADPVWFADNHPRLFATFPIRDVGFSLEDAAARDALTGCPGLARLSGLGVSMWNWAELRAGLAAVARLRHATALRRLEVYAEAVHADPLEDLLNAPQFRTLEAFALWSDARDEGNERPPEDVVRGLARSSWLFAVRELRLDGNPFAALCERLGQDVAWTPRLTRLSLRGYVGEHPAGTPPGTRLGRGLRGGWFAAVEDLDLGLCGFGREVCDALAAGGVRPARLALPARFRPARSAASAPLIKSLAPEWLSNLRVLNAPRATDAEVAALLASGLSQRLRVLDLSNGVMSAGRLAELRDVPGGWPCLESLDLSDNPLPDDALAELIRRLDRFPRLVSLAIGNYQPLPKFVAALAASPAAAQLRELSLNGLVTSATTATLVESPHLGGVDLLRVLVDGLPDAGRERLRQRFGPRVTIDDAIPF